MGDNKTLPTYIDKALVDDTLTDLEKRWHWLITQCAKSLGESISDDEYINGTRGNFELFNDAVTSAYQRRSYENHIQNKDSD